jgi:hypothetical protein
LRSLANSAKKMTRNYLTVFFLLICIHFSCGGRTVSSKNDKIQSTNNDSLQSDPYQMVCKYSDSNYEFEFEGCDCEANQTNSDTIFIHLDPDYGGQIQGNFVKVLKPELDNSYYLLKKHQNRSWTFSEGPDVVLDKWLLYNSPFDTIKYDPYNYGFFVDTIPMKEQSKFVKYQEDDFFRAYYRADNAEHISQDTLDNPPKSELDKYKKNKQTIFELTSAEIHRIILVLKHNNKTEKVIVFTYGHMG